MSEGEKLTPEWGAKTAELLWNGVMAGLDIPWRGARVLDYGCSWGYMLRHLIDHREIGEAHGVDVFPAWRDIDPGSSLLQGMTLHQGEIDDIDALREERFDIITSSGTLMLLPPTRQLEVMRWIFDHLNPGGHCVIATRTYLSHAGADQHNAVATPLAHLVFGPREIDAVLARRGRPPLRYMNPSCGATYLMLFRRVGFEIVDVVRATNTALAAARERFPARLAIYDPVELGTSEIRAHLRRPAGVDLSELRAPA